MADKYIPINPADQNFARLMRDVKKGILQDNQDLIDGAKEEFAKANISLFVNKERGLVRVLQAGRPPIDFPLDKPQAKEEAVKAEPKAKAKSKKE